MAEENNLPLSIDDERVDRVFSRTAYSRFAGKLDYVSMAAYLMANCHDPSNNPVVHMVTAESLSRWTTDSISSLIRDFKTTHSFDQEAEALVSTDLPRLLYELGRAIFASQQAAEEYLQTHPVQPTEQECIDALLGDMGFAYSLKERTNRAFEYWDTNFESSPLTDDDLGPDDSL